MNDVKVCKTFKSVTVNVEKLINKQLREKDLSLTQGIVLIWLNENEVKELPLKVIERKFGTAQSTTLGVINRLEQKKLISTYFSKDRKKIVKITDSGFALIDTIEKQIDDFDELMFTGFTAGEKLMFVELLKKAENNILQQQGIDMEDYHE